MVCTSHNTLADGTTPTGLWLGELAEPYWVLRDAGYDVTLASPAGGEVPVDGASLQGDFKTPEATRFLEAGACVLRVGCAWCPLHVLLCVVLCGVCWAWGGGCGCVLGVSACVFPRCMIFSRERGVGAASRAIAPALTHVTTTSTTNTPTPTRPPDETKQLLAHTIKLSDITDAAYYDCIFLPGGHGPVFDLASSELLAEVLGKAAAAGVMRVLGCRVMCVCV